MLPDPLPPRLLFVSAGSGITPIMSMLRSIARRGGCEDVVHVHCARTRRGRHLRREELQRARGRRHAGYRLHRAAHRRARAAWRRRSSSGCAPTGASARRSSAAPPGLLQALGERWRAGRRSRADARRALPARAAGVGDGERGAGGTIDFCASGIQARSDGEQPILVAGESAGAKLPYGCRMGICHSCVGRLRSGQVRDLRTGRVHGQRGELLRTCINAPEGAIEIEL